MSVEQLQHAIADLPDDELDRPFVWFDRYREQREDDEWDRQIEADVKAGKLDWLAEEVEEDIANGRTRPL
jgi:hypothetical protein